MLTFRGDRHRLCDGVSRRDFFSIGLLGLGALALPQLLRAEAGQGISRSHKSVIMIDLTGDPPHQDMVDLKPEAPTEIRGDFSPIGTCSRKGETLLPGEVSIGRPRAAVILVWKPRNPTDRRMISKTKTVLPRNIDGSLVLGIIREGNQDAKHMMGRKAGLFLKPH